MPYSKISELPKNIKNSLPEDAQKIFMAAFNTSLKEKADSEPESFKIAWGAVKNHYYKNKKGNWVKKNKKFKESLLALKNPYESVDFI